MKICILTTTYNRVGLLERLFESLQNQNETNFSWLVIDDGSDDDTFNFIEKAQTKSMFTIVYDKIDNVGKSRALNYAFRKYKDTFDYFQVVDSDDFLKENIIGELSRIVGDIYKNHEIGAIFFQYDILENGILTKNQIKYEGRHFIGSKIEHDKIYGNYDGSVGYFSRTIKKYLFPEISTEKYLGPTVLQILISPEFKLLFINTVIGIAEYQEKGLTKIGRSLRIKNPIGMIIYSGLRQKINLGNYIKYSISAQAYYYFYKKMQGINDSGIEIDKYLKKWAKIPGFVLYKYWSKKIEVN